MPHARLVADTLDAKDDVVGVFLQGVIHRRLEVGLRPVVVDAQPAAHVQVANVAADTAELGIDAGCLVQGILHVADVGDLAAQVKVHQLQTIGQIALLEVIERLEHLGHGEPKFGAIPGARFPAPRPARGQLDAHADHRPDAQLLSVTDDGFELGKLFDDRDDVLADFAGQDRHLDEFIVLEAVADDRRTQAVGERQDSEKLRL